MIHKLEHIGVMVNDMEVSIDFYSGVLGLRLIRRERVSDKVELAFLSLPGDERIQIELISGVGGSLPDQGKVNHIAFTVGDIEAEIARLKAAGVRMTDDQPRTILDGIRIAFFNGPDGERLELFQPKQQLFP